jgi:hypothetical protein
MSDLKAIIVRFFPTLNKAYCIVLGIKGHEADNVTTEVAQSKNRRYQRCNQNPYIEEEQIDNTMAKRKRKQFRIRLLTPLVSSNSS